MKKVLFASVALAMSAGWAAAEVTVGGDGRMGLIYDGTDWAFTSRIRIAFTATGETDGGLAFGGSVRADHYDTVCTDTDASGDLDTCADGGAVGNTAMDQGSVFISGAFGKISFGDNDTAANATVGQVAGVGLTGLGDQNEIAYAGQTDTSVLYTFSTGAISLALSSGQVGSDAFSVAAKYSTGGYSFAIGYEETAATSMISVGADATIGSVSVAARYGDDDVIGEMYAVSVGTTFGATSVTAFFRGGDDVGDGTFGLGASYDLGGGAKVVGGIVQADGVDAIADIGISMTF
jgi:outer membrane protein OmpU